MFHIVGGAIDIIQAEGLPPGKMSIFITIRIAATICTRAKTISAGHRYPASAPCFGGEWWVTFGEQTWVISPECRSPRGVFKGWTKQRADKFMKKLVDLILSTKLVCFGSIVPIHEYRQIFPGSQRDDPYFLALRHTIINMGKIGTDIAQLLPDSEGMKLWHEENIDTSPEEFRIYSALKNMSSWEWGRYLKGFAVGDKSLLPLQGADLVAREAFKHADNYGVRPVRIPVKAMKMVTTFHQWNRACLEYLRDNGGPTNLQTLTEWGKKRPPEIPLMTHFYREGFDKLG